MMVFRGSAEILGFGSEEEFPRFPRFRWLPRLQLNKRAMIRGVLRNENSTRYKFEQLPLHKEPLCHVKVLNILAERFRCLKLDMEKAEVQLAKYQISEISYLSMDHRRIYCNACGPAIVVLLMSMVNEKQPFVLRCAVLYCFQSFLYKNEVGQSQIIQTLLPTAADANSITAGQLLCGGLFNADPLSNWFSAVAILHAIVENSTQKEQLLRVQLATSLGNPPVSLLQQCCNMLSQGGKVQTKIALLMILCGWLADCPIAVSHFLSNTANVPYLISQVSSSEADEHEVIVQGLCAFLLGICMLYNNDTTEAFTKSALKQVIQNRIGLESFTDKLMQVAQNENYTRAAKKPHLYHKHPNEIVFDYEFTRLFKLLENEVLKAVSGTGSVNGRLPGGPGIDHYKALLKEQEDKVLALRKNLEEMQAFSSSSEKMLSEFKSQVQQLKDQNALLKAQKANQGTPPPSGTVGSSSEETQSLKKELESMRLQLKEKDAQLISIISGVDRNDENGSDATAVLQGSLTRLQGEVASRDSEIKSLRAEIERLNQTLLQKSMRSENASDQGSMHQDVESQVAALTLERNNLDERLRKANEENLKLTNNIRVSFQHLSKRLSAHFI
ncbi:general vesicular transport factor p115-like [Plakobranchus ocellatus]|uniref:General vesicular transport factor p115-like n=1 Tax=Plakobranchus ocellatus TaxID=259542 RepID=A0AAV3YEP4_9GAST|nr:general vesicular transport factor p115-like [Plakobranchus ocellatus]